MAAEPLMSEMASVAAPPGIAVYLLVFVNIGLAVAGRAFLPEEDRTPGTHPVVVMSYGCRQQTAAGGLTAGADSSNEIVE